MSEVGSESGRDGERGELQPESSHPPTGSLGRQRSSSPLPLGCDSRRASDGLLGGAGMMVVLGDGGRYVPTNWGELD